MQEKTDQKNYEYEYFLRSVSDELNPFRAAGLLPPPPENISELKVFWCF